MSTNPYLKISLSQITLQNSIKYYCCKISKSSKCGIDWYMFNFFSSIKLKMETQICAESYGTEEKVKFNLRTTKPNWSLDSSELSNHEKGAKEVP